MLPSVSFLVHSAPDREVAVATELTPGRRAWLMTVASAALALIIGGMSALYTSLTDIAVDTGASQSQLTWIVDAYTLALAALVLTFGAFGDRVGRRLALISGLAVFTVATALPLVLDSPTWLIVWRGAAGVGAALIMPSTLSLLTATFPEDKRGRAVGVWAGVAGTGAMLGILLSGVLLTTWSWKSTFIVSAAVGLVLCVASLTIPESRSTAKVRFDALGAALSALAVGTLVAALIEGPHLGWTDPLVVTGFAIAVLATAGFVMAELRTVHPLLDVRYFRRRGFSTGSLSVLFQFLVMFGLFLLLVQFLQNVRGYDPLGSALALAPMIAPILLLSLLSSWFAPKLGLRVVTVLGLLSISAGLWWFSHLSTESTYFEILWPMLVVATGLGLCTAPATTAIVADTPVDEHGVAAAVNDATREIGAAIGIAIAGSTLGRVYTDGVQPLLVRLPDGAREVVENSLAGATEVASKLGPAGEPLLSGAQQAYTDGVSQSLIILAICSAVGAAIALFVAPSRNYVPEGNTSTSNEDHTTHLPAHAAR